VTNEVALSADVRQALDEAGLAERFYGLAPSHQTEYLRWINEAKRADTRRRRIEGMLSRLAMWPIFAR
jgi:uncharacterized protein YdeI (YjbR/CyaY-like superfamily)